MTEQNGWCKLSNRCGCRRSLVVAGVIVAACFVRLNGQESLSRWKLDSAGTRAMDLVSVTETETSSTFSFKNVSDKTILAYTVSLAFEQSPGSASSHTEDCFDSRNYGLCPAPGVVAQFNTGRIPISADRTLRVLAVVFEDGSGTGEESQVNIIKFDWLGRMLERERINNLLNGPITPSATDEGIKELGANVGRLPERFDEAVRSLEQVDLPGVSVEKLRQTTDKGYRGSFLAGVRAAREDAQQELGRLSRLPVTSADPRMPTRAAFLSKLRQRHIDFSAKYHEFCKRSRLGAKDYDL